MSQTEYEEIELSIKEAKKISEAGKALERLRNNRDFKKVILDGYLQDEAIRLVHLKADPSMQDAKMQENIDKQITAIGGLVNYLNMVRQMAVMADKSIADSEEVLESMRSEDIE